MGRTNSYRTITIISPLISIKMGLYEVVLSVMNLVILISSTACLYLSSIMINIYLLPYLEVVNSHFATVSYLILAIGFFLLLFSFLGIGAALSNSRPALILYAVFMSIVVLMELASIFVSMELRQELERKIMFQTVPKEMSEEMSKYWYDEDVRYKWDALQRDFQCCGALNLRTGFQDWDRIRHSNIANDSSKEGFLTPAASWSPSTVGRRTRTYSPTF